MKLNKLTALSQFDVILSYRVRHAPVHMVVASVAFAQVASDSRADTAIPQGPHMVLNAVTSTAVVYIN